MNSKPTVLIVDDDPSIRTMLAEMLSLEGYDWQPASQGGEALDLLRASNEGMVVLLGLVMPVVDGLEVLEAVAADETLAARHAIVMVTGSVESATTSRVAELRARLGVPLVAKPCTLPRIIEAVEEAATRLGA